MHGKLYFFNISSKTPLINLVLLLIFVISELHFINKLYRFYDAAPGNNSTELSFIEDKYLTIKNIVEGDQGLQQTYNTDFRDRFLHLPKGGKFELYHNDDYTDSITQVAIVIRYIYSKKSSNN